MNSKSILLYSLQINLQIHPLILYSRKIGKGKEMSKTKRFSVLKTTSIMSTPER